jgi:hypothetical protein
MRLGEALPAPAPGVHFPSPAGLLLSERSACKECERLGREYGELMLSHVTLEDRFLDAKLRHDHELAKAIVGQMRYLGAVLAGKRQAMRDHLRQVHRD